MSLGVPIPCEIKGGDTQRFSVKMEAGQYARVDIERNGVDLRVTLISLDGVTTTTYENAAGPKSRMSVSLKATAAGLHAIEVQTVQKWTALGSYQIKLESVGTPTTQDEKRLAAQAKVAEGRSKQFVDAAGALLVYTDALVLWRELIDPVEEANTLQFMAETYRSIGDFKKANEHYTQALTRRVEEDKQARAYTLLALADSYLEANDFANALDHFEQALRIFENTDNRRGQGAAQYGLGLTFARQSEMVKALVHYRKALAIYTEPQSLDLYEEARTTHAMGGALDVNGQPQQALELYQRALDGWRETGDLGQEGNTFSSLAKFEMDRGNWQLAFDTYDKALALYERAELVSKRDAPSLQRRRASTLYNLGYTYAALGDYARALEIAGQSLSLRQPGNRGPSLMLIGYFHALAGHPDKALEYCNEALAEQEPKKHKRRSETYTVMGVALAFKGEHEEALELYDKALAIQKENGNEQAEAITQGWRGDSLSAVGQHDAALIAYQRAREIYGKYGEVNGVAAALIGMSRSERGRNNLNAALGYVTEAIAAIEPLRSNVSSELLRSSYFGTKIDYYEQYIDICMQKALQGDAEQLTIAAFEASERARARTLLETLPKARIEVELKSDPALAASVSNYRRIQRLLQSAKSEKYKGPKGRPPAEESQLELDRQRIESQIRAQYPRYAALMFPQPLTAPQVRKLLDSDTLLLEFSLGEQRSYVWEVTATELHAHTLPPRKQIEDAARLLVNHLAAGQYVAGESASQRKSRLAKVEAEYWSQAKAFSAMLLGKLQYLSKKKNLVIVADGQLQYVPFAALPSPHVSPAVDATTASTAIVKTQQITNLQSASVLGVLRESPSREQPSKLLAVFADPVFEKDDSRIPLTRANQARPLTENRSSLAHRAWRDVTDAVDPSNLPRLPASFREAQQIIQLVPRNSSLLALGFQANRETATSKQLGLFKVVHFATHGILDEINPERSGVVLSLYDKQGRFHEEGFLSVKDIYELNLPVELVVLSACRTGLGKPVKGEGLIGLARAFMYAGSQRVLASLWKVDDDATAELMKRFYHHMLREGMTPSAALRAAQSSMSSDGPWRNPYYWAGFVLQGEPR